MSTTAAPETTLPVSTVEPPPPPPPPPSSGSRKRIVIPIVILLVLAAAVWGVKQWTYGRAHESTDNAQVDGHIIPVIAKVGGYVTTVNAAENAPTREGVLLVQIDTSEYAVRLAQANADLQAAEATAGVRGSAGQAQAAVQSAQGQSAAGQAQIAAVRATLAQAESDLRRFQTLAGQQIISQQQLESARTAVEAARANVTAVERQAAAAGAGVASAEAGVRLARARLAGVRAARDNAALQLSYTHILAPATGVLTRKQVEVGQLVQPGQTLASVVADTGVWVTANVKETQLDKIRVGQRVELEVDAYDGAIAEGTVESISSATGARFALLPPDNATGNFTKVVQRVPVRVRVTRGLGAARPLRPGMSVNAHIATG